MTFDVTRQASEEARFAARTFVGRWARETGQEPVSLVTERMLFAYEMGYLRGHGDGFVVMPDHPSDLAAQSKRAAREFVARWSRETGEEAATVVMDRMLFAYEMGHQRGHGEGVTALAVLSDELERKVKMPNMNEPKALSPKDLADQLFDASLAQVKGNYREAARQVVVFLTESLMYAVSAVSTTTMDEATRGLLKDVGQSIVALTEPPPPPSGQ